MNNRSGCLYGIGIGPGDSGLITLKAIETLKTLKTVFVPQSAQEKESLALEIAQKHLSPDSKVETLLFPMIKDPLELAEHWERAAAPVVAALSNGDNCGFLTLGDPMLYSTFIYLVRAVQKAAPEATIESIPGISSAFAAASKSLLSLAEGGDSVALITGERIDRLESILKDFQTVIIMKVGKRLPEIKAELLRLGLDRNALLAHRVGLEDELVAGAADIEDARLGYLSTIIVRKDHKTC